MRRADSTRFVELQRRLVAADATARAGRRTLVVVPSRTIDKWHEPAAESHALEERLLCHLLMLREPGVRIVYLTSTPLPAAILDYHLSLLPRGLRRSARARVTLMAAGDPSTRPLSEKLLAQPALLARLRRLVSRHGPSHLVPYATTEVDRDLALALDTPLYGADPRLRDAGTKSGARRLFARVGAPHPLGVEGVATEREVVGAIARLRAARPDLERVVVKLDEGAAGDGNATVDLRALPRPGEAGEGEAIAARLRGMAVEADGVSAGAYLAKLAAQGGIVEEWIAGREARSPSVQLDLRPAGGVAVASTHDQLLGGRHGQSYRGCRFPADPGYAAAITEIAAGVGRRLAADGVIGRCAVDFVVARDDGGRWHPYAIEINLRRGGTTHPFATLEHITGGRYDARSAVFTTPAGGRRHYVASDHLASPLLRRLGPSDLLDIVGRGRLGFDRAGGRGVVFHMLGALRPLGRVGLTAIGDTPADAERRYANARAVLLEEAIARPEALGWPCIAAAA